MGSPKSAGPVRARNAKLVYEALEKHSQVVDEEELLQYGYPAQADSKVRIFVGFASKIVQDETNLLYSAVLHATGMLNAMNCTTLLVKGGGGTARPSVYILHYKPTDETIKEFLGRSFAIERKTMPTHYDTVINELAEVKQRLNALEQLFRDHLEGRIQ